MTMDNMHVRLILDLGMSFTNRSVACGLAEGGGGITFYILREGNLRSCR